MKKIQFITLSLFFLSFFQGMDLLHAQPQKAREVIHYWHFNQVSGTFNKALADYSVQVVKPEIEYRPAFSNVENPGTMDDFEGTALNARMTQPAGKGIRTRNPSDSMGLLIHLPSQGYRDLILSYATQRSPNGMLNQVFDISTNGIDFTSLSDTLMVTGVNQYEYASLDLSSITTANNNPNLWVRIRFVGQNTGTNGNNRFDNFVLTGTALNEAPDLLYYWHFNTLQTPNDVKMVAADYSYNPLFVPSLEYTGFGSRDMDAFDEGTPMNKQLSENAGKALRVRNPAFNRYLHFPLPTQDCHQLYFEYAVHRSGNGMLRQMIEYTTDGINYSAAGLNPILVDIAEEYQVIRFDFNAIPASQNNPNFAIRLSWDGNHTGDAGNNRFDNISLKGVYDPNLHSQTTPKTDPVKLYPNPTSDHVLIESKQEIRQVKIYSIEGKLLLSGDARKWNLSELVSGLYRVTINFQDGTLSQHTLIKN